MIVFNEESNFDFNNMLDTVAKHRIEDRRKNQANHKRRSGKVNKISFYQQNNLSIIVNTGNDKTKSNETTHLLKFAHQ